MSSGDSQRWGQVPSPVGETSVSPEAIAAEDEDGVEPGTAEAIGEQSGAGHSGSRHGTGVALSTSALLAVVASVGALLMVVWRRGRKRREVIGRHRLLPDPTADLAD
jgi:hypothetical protein